MGILSSRNCYNDIVLEKIKSPNNILTLNDPPQKQMNLSQGDKKKQNIYFFIIPVTFLTRRTPCPEFIKLASYFFRVYVEKIRRTNQFQCIP